MKLRIHGLSIRIETKMLQKICLHMWHHTQHNPQSRIFFHPRSRRSTNGRGGIWKKIHLEGFFAKKVPKEYYLLLPVINFESRVLKPRGELESVFQLLRQNGYGIHEKRVDTLAIIGAQGLLLDNLWCLSSPGFTSIVVCSEICFTLLSKKCWKYETCFIVK